MRVIVAWVSLVWAATVFGTIAGAEESAEGGFLQEGAIVVALPGPDAGALDLATCLELAAAANEDLLQQREGLASLQGNKTLALATGMPRLEVQGAFSRGRDPSFAFDESFGGSSGENPFAPFFDYVNPLYENAGLTPPDVGSLGGSFIPAAEDIPAQTFWRAYLDTSWELRPTQVWRALGAAKDAIAQQEARVSDTANRTAEAVLQAYHGVVLARERLESVQRELEAREEFMAVTRRRFNLEFATPLDTLQAAVSLANLRPQIRRNQKELRAAGHTLNRLLGRDPMMPLAVVATFPIEHEVLDQEAVLNLAARRPDLQAQRLQSSIYGLQRSAAKAERHPYLSMEGRWGYVTRQLDELTDKGHDFWSAGVTLHIPIFDGLNVRGQVQQAEANLRRAESQTRALERAVRDEVVLALEELEISRADLEAAQLNMRQAEAAFGQIRLRYELGKADHLEVLNAQAERFTARTTLIEARFGVLSSTATLKRAAGISPARPLSTMVELAASSGNGER